MPDRLQHEINLTSANKAKRPQHGCGRFSFQCLLSKEAFALPPAALARLRLVAVRVGGRARRGHDRLRIRDIAAPVRANLFFRRGCSGFRTQIGRGFAHFVEGDIDDGFHNDCWFDDHRLDRFNGFGCDFSLRCRFSLRHVFGLGLRLAGAARFLRGFRFHNVGNHTFHHFGSGRLFGYGCCGGNLFAFAFRFAFFVGLSACGIESLVFSTVATAATLATTATLALALFIRACSFVHTVFIGVVCGFIGFDAIFVVRIISAAVIASLRINCTVLVILSALATTATTTLALALAVFTVVALLLLLARLASLRLDDFVLFFVLFRLNDEIVFLFHEAREHLDKAFDLHRIFNRFTAIDGEMLRANAGIGSNDDRHTEAAFIIDNRAALVVEQIESRFRRAAHGDVVGRVAQQIFLDATQHV